MNVSPMSRPHSERTKKNNVLKFERLEIHIFLKLKKPPKLRNPDESEGGKVELVRALHLENRPRPASF